MLNNYPKSKSNRNTYKTVAYFLNSLLEEKVDINFLVNKDTVAKINNCLLSRGRAFDIKIEDEILDFDKELEKEFSENTKNEILNIFKDSQIRKDLIKTEKEEYVKRGKKFLYLYLIFLQILSELAIECKDKANLLYKCFKLYFVEQEKRNIESLKFLKDKLIAFKEFTKSILDNSTFTMENLDSINEKLLDKSITNSNYFEFLLINLENLESHKNLIRHLLGVIKGKKEELYLYKTEIDTRVNIYLYIYIFNQSG